MPSHDIVVIGASAGGVEALIKLTGLLPADLPAAVFIVVHFPTDSNSLLPDILNRVRRLPAAHARQGKPFQPGRIYVAPTNRYLLLGQNTVRLASSPREHGFRPAIDPLFRSAARAFGPRVVGVILSGTLSDGAAGLQLIKERDRLGARPAGGYIPRYATQRDGKRLCRWRAAAGGDRRDLRSSRQSASIKRGQHDTG